MKTLRPMSLLKIVMIGLLLTVVQFGISVTHDKPLQEALTNKASDSLASTLVKTFNGIQTQFGQGQGQTPAALNIGGIQTKNVDIAQNAKSIIQQALQGYQDAQATMHKSGTGGG